MGFTSGKRRRYVQVGQREQRLKSLVSTMRLLMMMKMITMTMLMMKIMRKFMTTSMIVVRKHSRREEGR